MLYKYRKQDKIDSERRMYDIILVLKAPLIYCTIMFLFSLRLTPSTSFAAHTTDFPHAPPPRPLCAQIERKRHIGNDIVNIIFLDGCTSAREMSRFKPALIRSNFTHVYAVVAEIAGRYHLNVFSERSVPLFGPSLPATTAAAAATAAAADPLETTSTSDAPLSPSSAWSEVFGSPQDFRRFLLVKMINGEKAT